jgi:hypothetical protein
MNWARHFRQQSGFGLDPPPTGGITDHSFMPRKIAPGFAVRRIDLVNIVEQVVGGLILIALGTLVYRGAKRRQV